MFSNIFNQQVYIQEVCDPKSKKHYNVHIHSCIPEKGLLSGMIASNFYITIPDPHCGVLVEFGRQAYSGEDFNTVDELTDALRAVVETLLPEGIKRFEAIMAHGISGNELKQ